MSKEKWPVKNRLPAMTKLPVIPGVALTLSRASLGRKLYQPMSDFNLSDPYCHIMTPTYNTLHDPNLNEYYHQKQIHDKLKKENLITEDDKVVCSLKEYNTFKQYLDMVRTDHEKSYEKEMKALMLRMVQLQEAGHIPNSVTVEEIRAYLLKEVSHNLTQLQSTAGSRENPNLLGLLYEPKREIEMELFSNEQFRLKQMEKEVKHDLNKAKYLKDVKEKYKIKKMCLLDQKQAIQIRKMEEDVKNFHEFRRLMETTFKPNKLLEEIIEKLAPVQPANPLTQPKTVKRMVSRSGKSSKDVLPMPHRRTNLDCLGPIKRRPSLDGLKLLPCVSKKGFEKGKKTEQVQVRAPSSHTGTKAELGTASSNGFLKRKSKPPFVLCAPINNQQATRNNGNQSKGLQSHVLRISKAIEKQTIPDRVQLKSVHLGSCPVRKQVMESVRDKATQSISSVKPASQTARNAYDMLKCIPRADNPYEPASRACGVNTIKQNAEVGDSEPEEQFANEEDLNTCVKTLITNILKQVIVTIVEDSPTHFRVASAKASRTANDVVSQIFEDNRDLLDEGNFKEIAQDNDTEVEDESSRLDCAVARLIQTVFQDVKMSVDKIKKGSPKRGSSPKVSQTDINAVSSLLGEMETDFMASTLRSHAKVTSDVKEITAEMTSKHPVTLMDSVKIDLIAEDLVEFVMDVCCELISAAYLKQDDNPEEDPLTGTVPGPIQNNLHVPDVSHAESKIHTVKNVNMTQLTSYIAASSSNWPLSDCSIPLASTSSEHDNLIDDEKTRVVRTERLVAVDENLLAAEIMRSVCEELAEAMQRKGRSPDNKMTSTSD
ncbi:hypothetical protein DPEC_G00013070 [Dallia pectoralis]|uniref:Uncharacterized protein n=1 Tax=Dallia pectoralis TaxID=75939 RepID=A0ACC2HMS9_DALPE|nr:hypothetical protein DPEC_G00013070 [Dallia pectoralis]